MDEPARFELYKRIVESMRGDDFEPLSPREERLAGMFTTFFGHHLSLVAEVAELKRRMTH